LYLIKTQTFLWTKIRQQFMWKTIVVCKKGIDFDLLKSVPNSGSPDFICSLRLNSDVFRLWHNACKLPTRTQWNVA